VNGRDFSVGLVVVSVRVGVAAGKIVALPIRVAARMPIAGSVVSSAGDRVSRDGAAARAVVRSRAEEATTAVLAAPELEQVVDRALAAPLPDAVVKKLIDHVLASDEIDRVVEHVASSPAVRAAVTRQSTGLVTEVAAWVRRHTAPLDDLIEAKARSFLRRPARTEASPYGGVATRTTAFLIDVVLLAFLFLMVTALAGVAASLFGHIGGWPLATLLVIGWTVAAAAYFVLFWATVGQTPGMRVTRQRVTRTTGTRVGFGRALLRFFVLTFGFALLIVNAVVMLFHGRRRGLHDLAAGTVVTSV
jgi:uncharacterized RDD family membrane protein YckC